MNDTASRDVTGNQDHLTLKLAERAQRTQADDLPSDVREVARQCVLDWIGVALAGSDDHLTRILLDEAAADGGKPAATVIGHAARVTTTQAALINGASSHVLDYDDVNLSLNGHPSAAILPALTALAESRGARGKDLIEAFVAGYEVGCRVGLLVAPGHYARGYHSTCTVGALGAAAACARLLGLDAERTAHAISIAATQAGGLKSMFGTECKPFHAGVAAHNGLRAARLAAAGMVSRPDALECRQGFASTMSPDFNPQAALGDPARFYIRDNLFKYHASCYGTHASIECVRQLREANAIRPEDVERVKLRVDKGADAMCNIPNPRTALEAKFSLRFMGAAALAGADTSDLAFFKDATTADATLCVLRDKVSVDFVSDRPKMVADVVIEMKDGRELRATHDAGVPLNDYAMQGRRLAAKFERLVEPVLGEARCGKLLRLLERLEDTLVADLMTACAK
ncbi:MAG TPA: MmgE/PrpD family protein [Burkholderiales bacterium]|nr:MmgE/PrpD family protein [Burkholderiales bacterium]